MSVVAGLDRKRVDAFTITDGLQDAILTPANASITTPVDINSHLHSNGAVSNPENASCTFVFARQ